MRYLTLVAFYERFNIYNNCVKPTCYCQNISYLTLPEPTMQSYQLFDKLLLFLD